MKRWVTEVVAGQRWCVSRKVLSVSDRWCSGSWIACLNISGSARTDVSNAVAEALWGRATCSWTRWSMNRELSVGSIRDSYWCFRTRARIDGSCLSLTELTALNVSSEGEINWLRGWHLLEMGVNLCLFMLPWAIITGGGVSLGREELRVFLSPAYHNVFGSSVVVWCN